MARLPRDAEGALDRARAAVDSAKDADELRAAQATLLPLLGYSLEQTAAVVGRDRWWVSRARNRFLRGESPPKHGGRRTSIASEDQEMALVKRAVMTADYVWGRQRYDVRSKLRDLLDRTSDRPPADSTITDMLNRVAPKVIRGATGTHLLQGANHLAWIWKLEELLSKKAQNE